MSRTFHDGTRRIKVRVVRREKPDLRKVARAMIELAAAESENQAMQEHAARLAARRAVEIDKRQAR